MRQTHVTRYPIFGVEQKISYNQARSSETLIQISQKLRRHIPERSKIDESIWKFENKRPFIRLQ
jgi:hypothetical protein